MVDTAGQNGGRRTRKGRRIGQRHATVIEEWTQKGSLTQKRGMSNEMIYNKEGESQKGQRDENK
jgi:hypothetical protein